MHIHSFVSCSISFIHDSNRSKKKKKNNKIILKRKRKGEHFSPGDALCQSPSPFSSSFLQFLLPDLFFFFFNLSLSAFLFSYLCSFGSLFLFYFFLFLPRLFFLISPSVFLPFLLFFQFLLLFLSSRTRTALF